MRETKGTITVERVPAPPPGVMGRYDLLALSIGTVLGTGLLTFLPTGIAGMGTSAIFGFPLAVILGFFYLLPVTAACSVVRMGGGLMSLVGDMTTPLASGLYGMGSTLSAVALSMYGITFASYLKQVIPSIPSIPTAILITTVFYLLNLAGVKTLSSVQKVMSVVLFVGLGLFIVMGIPKINQPIFDFSNANFLPNDFGTTFAGLMVLYGCCASFQSVSCMGRLGKNSKKDLPFALIATSVVIFVLYFFCAIVAAGVLPYDQISDAGTLVPVLKAIFPNWLFVIWLVAIPGLLVFTTLNGLFATFTEQFAQCARDGWFPTAWAKTNKKGIPVIPLTVIYAVACLFILTGLSPSQIILCTNILNIVFDIILFVSLVKLPSKYPEQWAKSKFHMPQGLWVFLNILRVVIRGAAAYSAIISLSTKTMLLTVVMVVVCIGWCIFRAKTGDTKIRISCWADD